MPDETPNVGEQKSERPNILDKVDYVYTSFAQFTASNIDFRIALGDRIPPEGKVKPCFGIVMSHDQARAFLKAMTNNMGKLDELLKTLKGTGVDLSIPEPEEPNV